MFGRIVVVDDSPTVCSIVRRLLEREWWEVETYLHPLEALQALWQRTDNPPTAVILDIELPQVDGYEIAHLIRTRAPECLRSVPILGLSARDGTLDRVKGRVVGMDAYLAKPFDASELLSLLATFPVQPGAMAS